MVHYCFTNIVDGKTWPQCWLLNYYEGFSFAVANKRLICLKPDHPGDPDRMGMCQPLLHGLVTIMKWKMSSLGHLYFEHSQMIIVTFTNQPAQWKGRGLWTLPNCFFLANISEYVGVNPCLWKQATCHLFGKGFMSCCWKCNHHGANHWWLLTALIHKCSSHECYWGHESKACEGSDRPSQPYQLAHHGEGGMEFPRDRSPGASKV